jgi:ligand-binding sensor domain-containing protein
MRTRVDTVRWIPDLLLARAMISFTRIDQRGWLWVGTESGVTVFDGQTWRRLSTEDGLKR